MLVWCIDIWKRKKQLRDKEWQGEKSLAKVPESVLRGLGYIHYIHAKKGTMLNRRRERFKKKKKSTKAKIKVHAKKKNIIISICYQIDTASGKRIFSVVVRGNLHQLCMADIYASSTGSALGLSSLLPLKLHLAWARKSLCIH